MCEKEPAPIWNETCTLYVAVAASRQDRASERTSDIDDVPGTACSTTDVMSEAQLVLEIDVLDRTDRVFGSDRVVTRVALPLRDIPYDAMQDVWVECFPFVELAAVPPIHPLDHRASSIPSVSEAQRTPQRDQPPAAAAASTPLLGSAPSQQQQQHLPTPVVSVVVRRTSQLTPIEPGGQARSIAMPACNINYYTLDDRLWFAPPPSSVEQQEAGNDSEAMHEAKLARLCDGIDAKYSRAPCARLHLMYHKSLDPKAGPWSFYGTPQVEVPLRMDAGDIILVNSSYFLTHSIKVTTWSQVRPTPEGSSFSLCLILMRLTARVNALSSAVGPHCDGDQDSAQAWIVPAGGHDGGRGDLHALVGIAGVPRVVDHWHSASQDGPQSSHDTSLDGLR